MSRNAVWPMATNELGRVDAGDRSFDDVVIADHVGVVVRTVRSPLSSTYCPTFKADSAAA